MIYMQCVLNRKDINRALRILDLCKLEDSAHLSLEVRADSIIFAAQDIMNSVYASISCPIEGKVEIGQVIVGGDRLIKTLSNLKEDVPISLQMGESGLRIRQEKGWFRFPHITGDYPSLVITNNWDYNVPLDAGEFFLATKFALMGAGRDSGIAGEWGSKSIAYLKLGESLFVGGTSGGKMGGGVVKGEDLQDFPSVMVPSRIALLFAQLVKGMDKPVFSYGSNLIAMRDLSTGDCVAASPLEEKAAPMASLFTNIMEHSVGIPLVLLQESLKRLVPVMGEISPRIEVHIKESELTLIASGDHAGEEIIMIANPNNHILDVKLSFPFLRRTAEILSEDIVVLHFGEPEKPLYFIEAGGLRKVIVAPLAV